MAILNGQVGDPGGTNTDFVNNTRVWFRGDTTFSTNPLDTFDVAAGNTVSADDCVIVASYLGSSASTNDVGTFDFRDVVISTNNAGQASSGHNWTFNNVTYLANDLTATVNIGKYAGTLNNTTAYNIDGFNVFGNVDATDPTLGFLIFFPAFNGLTANSVLNNVSLWNGEADAETILGSGLTFAYNTLAGLRSGPVGFRPFYDASSNARALFRCAFGATNNNWGHLTSYDFRAIEGDAAQWRFALDFAGKVRMINPLVGTPTGKIAFACGTTSNGSAFQTYIGQQPRIEGDVKFVNADTTVTMVTFPAEFNATSVIATSPNVVTQLDGAVAFPNGVGFEVQNGTLNNGNVTLYSATGTNPSNVNFVFPQTRIYRTYSWQQAEWGMNREINPTDTGATDAQVAADRESGIYPFCTADGFQTNIQLAGTNDPITDGFDTVAEAVASLHTLGGATNPRDVLASIKAAHHEGVTETHVDLPYVVNGSTATIDANITFSATSTTAPTTTGNVTVPTSSLATGTVETILQINAADPAVPAALRSITVVGGVLNNTENKAILNATGAFSTLDSVNNATISASTIAITGSATNSTLTGTGTGASSVGSLADGTTLTVGGALTIGDSASSNATAAGVLSLANDFNGTGSTISGDGITNFQSGTVVTGTTSRLVDFNATNTGAAVTIPTDYVISGNLTGNWIFDGEYTIEGDATIGGDITVNDGSTITIVGLNAGFTAVPTFGDGPLGITIILDEGASQNSAFNGETITDPDVNVESNPYDVTINNTGVGNLYFRILKVVPGANTAAVLDTDYALLGGGNWQADNSLPSGGTGVIRITETQIGAENWLLYVAGQSLEDTRVPLTYSLNDPIVNPAIDPGYSTAGIPSTYAGWSIATDEVQFLTANIENPINAGTPIELDIDPALGDNQPLTDFTVYGSVPAGTTVTAVGGVAGAYTVTLSANAQAGDNIFITYPGNSNFQFGINIPSGSVLTTPSVLNNAIGTFKSNQQYADYIAFTDDVDPAEAVWESKGIQFIDREDTRLYYEGPGDAQFILEQTDVGENPTGYRTGFLDTTNGDWDGMPVISSGTTVRAIPNLDQLQSTGADAVRFKMDVGGDDRFVTVDTWNNFIDNRNNAFFNIATNYTHPGWGPTSTTWDSAATNNVRHLEFRLERTDNEAFPDGIFRVVGWTTNNVQYTNIDTTEGTGVNAAAGTIVTGLALEWDYTDFSQADQITYGLRPDINTVDPSIFYRTDSFFGAGNNTATYHPITFSTVVQLPATGVPPIRTFINVTLGTSANEIQSNGFRGLIVDPADPDITAGSINLDTTNTAGVNNWNAAFVNGLEGSFTPAGGTATAVDAGIVSATPPEVDYLLIRAQAEQALANFGAATETNVDEVETKIDAIDGDLTTIDGKVDDARTQVDNNNKRLININTGQANKIPIRRAYDSTVTPDTV